MTIQIKVGRVASIALFAFLLFFLTLAAFTLVRCQPIERDIEIDCKWKGEPVSANLKWTEPEEDPATITTNKDAGGMSKSGASSSQESTAINTQQALMLTGTSAGAALVGGGLLVKKKLEGISSSEQETKQTTSTSSTNSTAPKYASDSARSYREGLEPHQDKLKSSQGQSSAQTRQSNTQNPLKDNGLTPTTSTLTASVATITKDLLMQKQMDSLNQEPKQSQPDVEKPEPDVAASTLTSVTTATITRELLMQKQMKSLTKQSTQTDGNPQPKETASSTSIPQGIGLLASPYSAAQIAAEMWPQRQKEFEQLAKQRADLAAKFSIPSYSTGLSLASSMINTADNAWARLQGFGSAIGNGLSTVVNAIKPYLPAIFIITVLVTYLYGGFVLGLFGAGMTGVGMASTGVTAGGISLGGGAGWVGAGIAIGMGTYTAYNLGIMNYPKQPSFVAEHTQIIEKPTSEIKDEKGSGTYGEDAAQEQLDQAEIWKDRIFQTGNEEHQEAEQKLKELIQKLGGKDIKGPKLLRGNYLHDGRDFERYPDVTSDRFIGEAKRGTEHSNDEFQHIWEEVYKDISLQVRDGWQAVWYILKKPPADSVEWQNIITTLMNNGVIVRIGNG